MWLFELNMSVNKDCRFNGHEHRNGDHHKYLQNLMSTYGQARLGGSGYVW